MFRRTFMTVSAAAAIAGTATFANGYSKDIVDTAIDAGSFTTLVAAADAAGLVETLKGYGPYTVFAPTDEAFAALPKGTVEELLMPENRDALIALLTYHVAPGEHAAAELNAETTLPTVHGGNLVFSQDDGLMVKDAKIVSADIEASNGVIHVIDSVLDIQ